MAVVRSAPPLAPGGAVIALIVAVCLMNAAGIRSVEGVDAVMRPVEIRSYTLVPGTGEEFHRIFVAESLPMLERWGVDVVTYGASLHDADSYLLVRAYADADARERSQEAFYGSAEWHDGPRARLLSLIESYTTVVLELDDAAIGVLRGAAVRGSTRSSPPPRLPG